MHYNKLSEILRAKNTEKVVKSCRREKSMFPVYEEKKKNLHVHLRTSAHASPHLHNSIEFIYITEGTLELGMGQELFHMEEGDFAVIFPDVIRGKTRQSIFGRSLHWLLSLRIFSRAAARKIRS